MYERAFSLNGQGPVSYRRESPTLSGISLTYPMRRNTVYPLTLLGRAIQSSRQHVRSHRDHDQLRRRSATSSRSSRNPSHGNTSQITHDPSRLPNQIPQRLQQRPHVRPTSRLRRLRQARLGNHNRQPQRHHHHPPRRRHPRQCQLQPSRRPANNLHPSP